jgi:antitoxin component YwqK of YwqJK toxin-antitoxin module
MIFIFILGCSNQILGADLVGGNNINSDNSISNKPEQPEQKERVVVVIFTEPEDVIAAKRLVDINGVAYLPGESEPFTGRYESYFDVGKKFSEHHYLNGRPHGLSVMWNENGQKSSETNYVNGKEDGIYKIFVDGKLFMTTNYKDGKKDGLETTYYPASEKKLSEKTYKDGVQVGLEYSWLLDGRKITRRNGKVVRFENEHEAKEPIQEIKNRCQKDLGEYGATMVKACVDQDLEALHTLSSLMEEHRPIVARCLNQMKDYGYTMVKACAEQDIEAEEALRKY